LTPTFTPSPTPTPVIHIIERGDTLFGVALDYGVTLEALVYANSIEATDILRVADSSGQYDPAHTDPPSIGDLGRAFVQNTRWWCAVYG
jgi:LysM repeat protein